MTRLTLTGEEGHEGDNTEINECSRLDIYTNQKGRGQGGDGGVQSRGDSHVKVVGLLIVPFRG